MITFLTSIKQYFCKHKFRAALQSSSTEMSFTKDGKMQVTKEEQVQVKICLYCMKKIIINDEQMYAEFGITNFIGK